MKYRKPSSPAQPARKGQRQAAAIDEDIAEEDEDSPIAAERVAWIEGAMPSYLETLSLVAENLSFKRYPNILKETIECILPIITLNRDRICTAALKIVQQFCNPLHGEAIQTVHYVFSYILPYLALDPSDKDMGNKDVIALKDISFDLVSQFMQEFGEAILPLLRGLIENLCIDVMDRAEFRQRTAQTALDLLHLVPEEHQKGISH